MNQHVNEASYTDKVQRIYGDLNGDIHLVEMERNGASVCLGLSLVGNKDIATMSVFVFGIEPSGLAGLDGRIHIGDELLEINGHVLYGRSHLNASAIIKGITSSKLKILLLRNDNCLQHLAVDPLQRMTEYKDSSATLIPKKQKFFAMERYQLTKGNENTKEDGDGAGDDDYDYDYGDNDDCQHVTSSVDSQTSEDSTAHQSLDLIAAEVHSCDIKDKQNITGHSAAENDISQLQLQEPKRKPKLQLILPSEINKLNEDCQKEIADIEISSTTSDKWKVNHFDGTLPEVSSGSSPVPGQVQGGIMEDPMTCPITSGKPTAVCFDKAKQALGIQIIGGSDTMLKSVFIYEIYKDGTAAKDGRLCVGDQILEANGENLKGVTHIQALQILRQPTASFKMLILRDRSAFREDDLHDSLLVDLIKKPGKGLGLSIVSKRDALGILVTDIIKGSIAEIDGRLMLGDEIVSVNEEDVSHVTQEYAARLLKTVTGKVSLSVRRLKNGLRPLNQLTSSYVYMYPEVGLKQSESHAPDYKSTGKQVTKSLSLSKSY